MSGPDALTAQKRPPSRLPERPCGEGRHYWPPDYDSGDTCQCGAWYLTALPDGTMAIEETPP